MHLICDINYDNILYIVILIYFVAAAASRPEASKQDIVMARRSDTSAYRIYSIERRPRMSAAFSEIKLF